MAALTALVASWQLAAPRALWVAAAVTLLLLFVPLRRRAGLAVDLGFWRSRLTFERRRVWISSLLVGLAAVLLAVLVADPYVLARQTVRIYGKPVMLVLDVSGSMESIPPRQMIQSDGPLDTRTSFEKARAVFYDLIGRRPEVNFGLLPFSTENYLARYFTYKNELFADVLDNKEEIAFISTGTRIAEALSAAHRILAATFPRTRGSEPDKAIVLVSDLDVDPEPFAEMADEIERARWAGIEVYVILIERPVVLGRPAPTLPPIKVVNMVSMNDSEGIDRICDAIAALPGSPIREEESVQGRSLVPPVAGAILGLALVVLVLSETCFRRLP